MIYFVYQLRVEDESLPFYVGKGHGDRAGDHLKSRILEKDTSHKSNKIRKAYRESKEVLIEYIEYTNSEDDAYLLETFYISAYGRKDLGLGPLTNKTDGGEGVKNITSEAKKAISDRMIGNEYFLGKKHSEETKKKMSESQYGKRHTEESIEKMKLKHSNRSEETREKLSLASKGKIRSEETKKKMSESQLGKRKSEETRRKMSLARKAVIAKKKSESIMNSEN